MADNPALLLTNQMMAASKLRVAILTMLAKRKVRRYGDFRLMVDFTVMPDHNVYGYNLRVFEKNAKGKNKPLISFWAETRDQLVNDENMLLLLMLYNS